MLLTNNQSETILTKEELLQVFYSGCKPQTFIGVESEKLLVYKKNNQAVKYEDVIKILNMFAIENNWEKVYDGLSLIALRGQNGTITLEPGSQIEISLKPLKMLDDIALKLTDFYTKLETYADKIGAKVLNIGIHPVSTYEDIKIIPKRRYEYMTKYLPSKGLTPFVMMRETAGIQANFDYKDEQDAAHKLALAIKMSPIISALYSNSPMRGGKLTEYKSFRANSWLNVDEDRCGFISKKLFEKELDFTFNDYVETLLDVPMIFIERNGSYYEANITFREFMTNGYSGLTAQLSDWSTHISLYFPDVRLKSYIEIRNHDAQNASMTYSVPAFWKGIIYNPNAMEAIEDILKDYSYEDFVQLRSDAPKYGINARLKNIEIIELIKEFFNISRASLQENGINEEKYLDSAFEYIENKRTPADDIIKDFQL